MWKGLAIMEWDYSKVRSGKLWQKIRIDLQPANDPLRFTHVLRLEHTIKPRICPGPSGFNLFFPFLSHLSSLFPSVIQSLSLVHPSSLGCPGGQSKANTSQSDEIPPPAEWISKDLPAPSAKLPYIPSCLPLNLDLPSNTSGLGWSLN
jgi:hypothetical protein